MKATSTEFYAASPVDATHWNRRFFIASKPWRAVGCGEEYSTTNLARGLSDATATP